MKKYLYFLFVPLFTTMSFALTSCGDDDDGPNDSSTGSSTLTINGESFRSNTIMDFAGDWNPDGESSFTVAVIDKYDNACQYFFIFTTSTFPRLAQTFLQWG